VSAQAELGSGDPVSFWKVLWDAAQTLTLSPRCCGLSPLPALSPRVQGPECSDLWPETGEGNCFVTHEVT
jgi:hypothetical protein